MTATQHAVWRNGGSNSAENDVRTRTEVTRRTFSGSRRCAKPLVVVGNVRERRRESAVSNRQSSGKANNAKIV
jgi:hypothetical protein